MWQSKMDGTVLLPSLRREEAVRLRWTDVDLIERKFTVIDTKNRDPHALPLIDYLHGLLLRLRRRYHRA
jgi:integrase